MKRTGLLWVLLMAAGAATAAGDGMKPGNYAYTMKMEMPGMPFAMPPQTFQRCLTQADVDQGNQYSDPSQGCEVRNLKQGAGQVTFDVACKDGTTGKAEYAYGSDRVTGKTVMSKDGQAMTMHLSGQRMGDCK
jgi:hypothetical protein